VKRECEVKVDIGEDVELFAQLYLLRRQVPDATEVWLG
jgi:hypothetical protein